MKLTSNQQLVANHDSAHALCIAVAGSGKTSTLAHLINNLLDKGVDARRMMVMMFNKSAQLDFTKKLRQTGQHQERLPEVRTYHSTGLRLLRTLEGWHARIPYNKQPLSDKVIELKVRELILAHAPGSIKERMRSDAARYIEAATGFIEAVKSNLTTPESWFEHSGLPPEYRFFKQIFHDFEQWRHEQQSITFTDMLYDPMCLVKQQPELVPGIENKIDYIIVDEYQDTSTLQHQFTRLIAGQRARVIAVGDPDQTIYEFAGANIDNILNHFQDDFGDTSAVQEMTLPHTFRYGHRIALAASDLISKNHARKNVLCIAHESNPESEVNLTRTSGNDSKAIIRIIKDYLGKGYAPQDIAILVRVWAQTVHLELSLLQEGIPYTCDGPSLFRRPEIETLLLVLKMAAGLFALYEPAVRAQHFTRMLTLPHIGLKNHYIDQIVQQLSQLEEGYGEQLPFIAGRLHGISQYQQDKLLARAAVFKMLEKNGSKESAGQLLSLYIRESELFESIRSMSLNEQRTDEQILAIEGFLKFIRQLKEDARSCCFHIDDLIARHQQRKNSKTAGSNNKVITLSSCHKAKGLEWPVVLLPGLTRQYWPFIREDDLSKSSNNNIEAERRLLYVAMTRARKVLHIVSCDDAANQWSADRSQVISPFLEEMNLSHNLKLADLLHSENDEELVKELSTTGVTSISRRYLKAVKPDLLKNIDTAQDFWQKSRSQNRNTARKTIAQIKGNTLQEDAPWQLNRTIRHAIFGEGKVTQVNDDNFVITFLRSEYGSKRFARNRDIVHLFEW